MTPDLDALFGFCAEGWSCSCVHAVLAFLLFASGMRKGVVLVRMWSSMRETREVNGRYFHALGRLFALRQVVDLAVITSGTKERPCLLNLMMCIRSRHKRLASSRIISTLNVSAMELMQLHCASQIKTQSRRLKTTFVNVQLSFKSGIPSPFNHKLQKHYTIP